MAQPPDNERPEDSRLARRFALLRDEEGSRLPPVPDERKLLRRGHSRREAAAKNRFPQVAAALLLALAAGLWMAGRPAPDPGQLYAQVMLASTIETDPLLQVAPGTLPETADLPGLLSDPDPDDWLESMGRD